MTGKISDDDGLPPRRPRGIVRVNTILDATEALLEERPDEDISLKQIADRAGVPLPSVYHFFPNRNAAFTALARRFTDIYYRMAIEPMPCPPDTWQDMITFKQKRVVDFHNERPAVPRLFLGAGVSVEVRAADRAGDAAVVRSRVRYFNAYFHMPQINDFDKKLSVYLAIQDGIWALSYGIHRSITPEYRDAAADATISYLANFIPRRLSPKIPTDEELRAIDVLNISTDD